MLFKYGALSFRQAVAVNTEYLQATKCKSKLYAVNLKKKKSEKMNILKPKQTVI